MLNRTILLNKGSLRLVRMQNLVHRRDLGQSMLRRAFNAGHHRPIKTAYTKNVSQPLRWSSSQPPVMPHTATMTAPPDVETEAPPSPATKFNLVEQIQQAIVRSNLTGEQAETHPHNLPALEEPSAPPAQRPVNRLRRLPTVKTSEPIPSVTTQPPPPEGHRSRVPIDEDIQQSEYLNPPQEVEADVAGVLSSDWDIHPKLSSMAANRPMAEANARPYRTPPISTPQSIEQEPIAYLENSDLRTAPAPSEEARKPTSFSAQTEAATTRSTIQRQPNSPGNPARQTTLLAPARKKVIQKRTKLTPSSAIEQQTHPAPSQASDGLSATGELAASEKPSLTRPAAKIAPMSKPVVTPLLTSSSSLYQAEPTVSRKTFSWAINPRQAADPTTSMDSEVAPDNPLTNSSDGRSQGGGLGKTTMIRETSNETVKRRSMVQDTPPQPRDPVAIAPNAEGSLASGAQNDPQLISAMYSQPNLPKPTTLSSTTDQTKQSSEGNTSSTQVTISDLAAPARLIKPRKSILQRSAALSAVPSSSLSNQETPRPHSSQDMHSEPPQPSPPAVASIQREPNPTETTDKYEHALTSPDQPASDSFYSPEIRTDNTAYDLEELSHQVYGILRRRLRVEQERLRGSALR